VPDVQVRFGRFESYRWSQERITAGTVLVGSFKYGAEVFWRQGLTLEFTNSDQDDFIKNLITVRCELRAALAVPHPLAFCSVTGM